MATTRGYRNNNPLNIRKNDDVFQGEVIPSKDKAFKEFKTMAYGYRAGFVVLRTYFNNYHLDTIRKLITRFAPADDNNHTENYIKAVSERSGKGADESIRYDKETMVSIVAAMSFVENGKEPDMADVNQAWSML